jgi:hypothetical protein
MSCVNTIAAGKNNAVGTLKDRLGAYLPNTVVKEIVERYGIA